MYYSIKLLNTFGHATAKQIAKLQGTRRQPHPIYSDIKNHPKCSTSGCSNSKIVLDWHWTSGKPIYRPVCSSCHDANTAKKYSEKTGATWIKNVIDVVAHKAGFNSDREYLNSKHPWRKYRKDYCENIDGRLNFTCTTTIVWSGQLDVDHIDENPSNSDPANFQTLCKCCHAVKGNMFIKTNGQTPGRKTLGIKY